MNVLSSCNTSHRFWENRTFACHTSEVILTEGSLWPPVSPLGFRSIHRSRGCCITAASSWLTSPSCKGVVLEPCYIMGGSPQLTVSQCLLHQRCGGCGHLVLNRQPKSGLCWFKFKKIKIQSVWGTRADL